MECWIHPNKKCNENCAAFLRLETANPKATPVHGLPLWQDKEKNGMWTYCALISALWEIAESLKRIKKEED